MLPRRPRLGAVSFLHRFGSALNRHVHLHACATDGLFMPDEDGVAFLPARPVTPADLAMLTERVRRRFVRWSLRKRFLDAPGRRRKATSPGQHGVVDLSPFEFLDRLGDLVPPPRKHRHRYHGVFAPNHPLRPAVTARAIGNLSTRVRAASSPPLPPGQGRGEGARTHEHPRSHDTS